ncbi:Crp/Fnr family transcriptional regulator [Sphingomonas sp. BK235]|jgi:CRP-like cAMP-binding protein|uniref:Crp/Fnr family transcriptional regulator n=1 Tax=Sphingomonas sp. BK235 TaxID=2512131 RepID=UPI0010527226|nr:Crp/Fnr family transcriptional regulator [Sphingomonas sp. BK235]TCP34648.1 CRP-like cAMP-binding protein [Sphingomonas sp. BK235]
MIRAATIVDDRQPALQRLASLAPLDVAALDALARASNQAQTIRARRELVSEGREIAEPLLLLRGWAARVRLLPDGRRQFLSFLLPGDVIGHCPQPRPLAVATIVGLTDVLVCPAPAAEPGSALGVAYAIGDALDQAYVLAQVTRLGRLNAQERIGDLLLELHERLIANGMARGSSFDLPLTQETLADALGLTSVHVNRMVQQARRENDLQWKGGRVTLLDPPGLARKIGRTAVRVSATVGPQPARGR